MNLRGEMAGVARATAGPPKSRRPGVVLIWGLLAFMAGRCSGVFGAESQPDARTAAFDAANRLYEQARYREAAAAYEALLAQGVVSPALYFNLGNAWFKAGEAGRAILNYRLAERLAPRDPDIRANLHLTRELVRGQPPPSPPWWQRWSRWLTLNEWAGIAGAGVWLGFGALVWGELRPDRRRFCRRWAAGFGGLALLAGAALAEQAQARWLRVEAVVVAKEAVVRYGPLEVSPELQKVEDGTELVVLDQKDDWLQVTGLPRGPGWIRQSDVLVLPP